MASQIELALSNYLVSETAELGFIVSAPTPRQRFFLVTDRCGFILGRCRRASQAVAVVAGHILALQPPLDSLQRFRCQSLLREGRALVVLPPLLLLSPPIERRLASSGLALVDSLVIDVHPQTGQISYSQRGEQHAGHFSPGVGHAQLIAVTTALPDRLFGLTPGATWNFSEAQWIRTVATTAVGGTRQRALDAAATLFGAARAAVPLESPQELHSALERTAP